MPFRLPPSIIGQAILHGNPMLLVVAVVEGIVIAAHLSIVTFLLSARNQRDAMVSVAL